MLTSPQSRDYQQGAATLLITLVLTMSITIITLAVARTQLVEQRISTNENWNTRLTLGAESGLARGTVYLSDKAEDMTWVREPDSDTEASVITLPAGRENIRTELVFSRDVNFDRVISIQAAARRKDGSNIQVRISQYVRLLSILTPQAENLPPLLINGCTTGQPRSFDIRPQEADTERAGDAIWSSATAACHSPGPVDTHNGALQRIDMANGLWPLVFSVDRGEFLLLAEQMQTLPVQDRRYQVAPIPRPGSRTWNTDLGSPGKPVVLYFPVESGCPFFSPGTTVYGIIYIESGCTDPVAGYDVSIMGALVVNGNLNIADSGLQLNNIQVADTTQKRLAFPVLRSVPVPGTWKDFQP